MLDQIKTAARRSHNTLLYDAAGALALVVMLLAALHIPMGG